MVEGLKTRKTVRVSAWCESGGPYFNDLNGVSLPASRTIAQTPVPRKGLHLEHHAEVGMYSERVLIGAGVTLQSRPSFVCGTEQ